MRRRRWLRRRVSAARAMPYPYAELKALYVYGLPERARGDSKAMRERPTGALAICDRLVERLYRPHVERLLVEVEHQGGA